MSKERRSFLTGLAGLAVGGSALAQEKGKTTSRFEPARHDKDDWLDELPGKHRLIFDTSTPDGVGDAILFGGNFLRTNQTEYGLAAGDLAVVMVVRHRSTPFGYTDAMWAKYGPALAEHADFVDPKSKTVPKINVYNSTEYGRILSNRGTALEVLLKRGVQLAVCSSATRAIAGEIVRTAGSGDTDTVYKELVANLIGNARMVPAGIVAVSRAQERGYTLART